MIVKNMRNQFFVYADEVIVDADNSIQLSYNAYGILGFPLKKDTKTAEIDYEQKSARRIKFNSGVSQGDTIIVQYFISQ